jgi:hypothetical protein
MDDNSRTTGPICDFVQRVTGDDARHGTLLAGYLAERGLEGKPTLHIGRPTGLPVPPTRCPAALLQHL